MASINEHFSNFNSIFHFNPLAVQHERKPVSVDKKDVNTTGGNSTVVAGTSSTSNSSGFGMQASTSSAKLSNSSPISYQQQQRVGGVGSKSQQQQQQDALYQHNMNAAQNSSSAAAAAAAAAFSLDNNIAAAAAAAGIFPMGLNFAELTQTLSKYGWRCNIGRLCCGRFCTKMFLWVWVNLKKFQKKPNGLRLEIRLQCLINKRIEKIVKTLANRLNYMNLLRKFDYDQKTFEDQILPSTTAQKNPRRTNNLILFFLLLIFNTQMFVCEVLWNSPNMILIYFLKTQHQKVYVDICLTIY